MSDGLNYLFIDLNAYFATCEQEARPELRGQPIAIVPVDAESTCCIAVSYQAKPYGIQTGMAVAQARALCPHLTLVPSRPRLYVEFHHRILAAIERCVPVQQVLSCDEFSCHLPGRDGERERATEIAYGIKRELRVVGNTLRCSIGIGPNRLLAKIAGEMQKPDGLMLLEKANLPHSLSCLSLTDIPGIGRRIEKRLVAAGIRSVVQLCGLSRAQMNKLWAGVLGDRMWLALRGEDFPEPPARPIQTLSRQHILPPHCRNLERAREISLKMLHATAMRLRRSGCWASGIWLQVGFQGRSYAYQGHLPIASCQDTHTLQAYMLELWKNCAARETPSDLTVALTGLTAHPNLDLFANGARKRDHAAAAIDAVNARYGQNTVYLGSIANVKREAPMRISFGPPPPLEDFKEIA